MKRLWNVIVLTLAMNFLAVAGGVGWLYQTGRLDRAKVQAVKEIVFPPPTNAPGAEAATTQPATTQPLIRLEELLAQHAGRAPGEQVDFIQRSFDAQMAQLDRRQRELNDLARQVEMAKQQIAADREALAKAENDLAGRERQATARATDKGFQDSLALYTAMPAKQVKTIFMTLDDATVTTYLQAMPPRTASKIVREFKTPDETTRVQRVLEQMRQAQLAAAAAGTATASGAAGVPPQAQAGADAGPLDGVKP